MSAPTPIPPIGTSNTRRPGPVRDRALWVRSAVIMIVLIAVLYLVEAIDSATNMRLDNDGIVPRETDGLAGIVWSPFLHAGFDHLTSNATVGAVLGFLLLLARRFLVTTAIVWIVSGVGVWLVGPAHVSTIGASGIIFGWLAFLLVRGLFNRSPLQILLGVALGLVYGSVLWGVLPTQPQISWQAHLFGAIGGVLAASVLAGRDRRRSRSAPAAPPAFGGTAAR
ncbi:rhomboid family intramembrane serine protease [Williamsia sp. MIQD14]|uniref:rhomboid family intramembrane serine protease n=1 Tax=Williamsia sp. MIQD14 TaxID=3425703 RepID=UPI003DA0FE7C